MIVRCRQRTARRAWGCDSNYGGYARPLFRHANSVVTFSHCNATFRARFADYGCINNGLIKFINSGSVTCWYVGMLLYPSRNRNSAAPLLPLHPHHERSQLLVLIKIPSLDLVIAFRDPIKTDYISISAVKSPCFIFTASKAEVVGIPHFC